MIKSLTSLRGIFILFIFFHHCLNLYPGGGTLAVAFFFILGGFGLTLGYKDRVMAPDFSYKQYILKRFVKFYPLHWICLIAVMPLVILPFSPRQIPILFINAALLQTLLPFIGVYFSFNAVSWYLANTMLFAVVSPFLIRWIVGSSTKGKIMIAVAFTLFYTVVALVIPTDMHHAILYISPYIRLMDFVLGIYLALGYLKLKEKPIGLSCNIVYAQIMVVVLIVLLVVESCILSKDTVLYAPVYWPLTAVLILIASLSSTNGGGQIIGK